MRLRGTGILLAALGPVLLCGCDWMPGKPDPAHRWVPASQETDFGKLYAQNCLGCHSLDHSPSLSISMGNQTYLAWVPREVLRQKIAEGVEDTAMPAFSESKGGLLNDQQIEILTDGILKGKIGPAPADLPPYAGGKGDVKKGQALFEAVYAPAGVAGQGLTNPFYLSLVSDSYLRAMLVAGFPELGLKDYGAARPGSALSNQEISDVVAWLSSLRPAPPPQGNP